MRLLLGLLLGLTAMSIAAAEDGTVTAIEVVSKGIYQVTVGEPIADPNAPTGFAAPPVTFTNSEATDTVPAAIGTEFGMEYRVVGAPQGADVNLDIVTIYPPAGLTDPRLAEPIRESRFQRTKKIGEVEYVGYGFEDDWEMVAGTWSLQIWYAGRKLFDESFTVTEP